MNSVQIAGIILIVVFSGALLGIYIGRKVPHHMTPETKGVVTASMAVVGAMTALVIGLLISGASSSFSARNEALARMSADVVHLDRLLRRHGSEADSARVALQRYTAMKTDRCSVMRGKQHAQAMTHRARKLCSRSRTASARCIRATMTTAGEPLRPCRSRRT